MDSIEHIPQPVKIVFDQVEYEYEKNDTQWTVSIKKSAAHLKHEDHLAVLKVPEAHFLPANYEVTEDKLIFNYAIQRPGYTAKEMQELGTVEKLKAAVNVLSFSDLTQFPYTFFLHPENVYFDYNLIPAVAYRGIKEQMPPMEMNQEFLLRNVKCYLISLFSTEYRFEDLYAGNLETVTGNDFINHIKSAGSMEELALYIKPLYVQKAAEEEEKYQKVDKKKYKWSRQLALWFGGAVVVSLAALSYFVFIRSPFQNRLLEADSHFVQNNYTEVISTLNAIKPEDLPATQKYMMAYSVVHGQSFNEEQKQVILNNVSLKSDVNYLDYWVHIGQGNYEEAIDLAKKIGDYDLILYGIAQIREQIINNPELSGEEREQQLSQYENQYEEYNEERNAILEEETEAN